MSFLERVIIEMAILNGKTENAYENIYTKMMRQVKDSQDAESGIIEGQDRPKPMPTNYVTPDENGYPGLEAPLG